MTRAWIRQTSQAEGDRDAERCIRGRCIQTVFGSRATSDGEEQLASPFDGDWPAHRESTRASLPLRSLPRGSFPDAVRERVPLYMHASEQRSPSPILAPRVDPSLFPFSLTSPGPSALCGTSSTAAFFLYPCAHSFLFSNMKVSLATAFLLSAFARHAAAGIPNKIYGVNLGSWLVLEAWMLPQGKSLVFIPNDTFYGYGFDTY